MDCVCFVNHHEQGKGRGNTSCISHGNSLNQPPWLTVDGQEIGEGSCQSQTTRSKRDL